MESMSREPVVERAPRGRWVLLWQTAVSALPVIAAILLVLAVLLVFWILANPPMKPGVPVFVRDVYVLLDPTGSMSADEFEHAKARVRNEIILRVAPGDRVFCYTIGPGFGERENRLFGDTTPPPVPNNFLDPANAGRIPQKQLADLWGEARRVAAGWIPALAALKMSNEWGSDYLHALDYVAERVRGNNQEVRSVLLIVLGDLYHQSRPQPPEPPDPSPDDKDAFAGVEVRLISPFRTRKKMQRSRDDVVQFWKGYFSDRGNSQITITPLGDTTPLLPASPVPHPERETLQR